MGKHECVSARTAVSTTKGAVRLIASVNRHTRLTKYFVKFNIVKLPDIYLLSASTFMYSYSTSTLPEIFSNFFTRTNNPHGHHTRSVLIYKTPIYKTTIGSLFIRKSGIDIWWKCFVNHLII